MFLGLVIRVKAMIYYALTYNLVLLVMLISNVVYGVWHDLNTKIRENADLVANN